MAEAAKWRYFFASSKRPDGQGSDRNGTFSCRRRSESKSDARWEGEAASKSRGECFRNGDTPAFVETEAQWLDGFRGRWARPVPSHFGTSAGKADISNIVLCDCIPMEGRNAPEIDDLRRQVLEARANLAALRTRARLNKNERLIRFKDALKVLQGERAQLAKQAEHESGLYWCNYSDVRQTYEVARVRAMRTTFVVEQ